MKIKKRTLTVRLSEALHEKLREIAGKKEMSMGEFTRKLLERSFRNAK